MISRNLLFVALALATILAVETTKLPVKSIERTIGGSGSVSGGVLSIQIDREDLDVVGPGGIPIKPAFEIFHEFNFQSLGNGSAFLNAEMAVLPEESNAVFDRILSNGLVFQAFHQHFFDLDPMVFFVHFRGVGSPLKLARAVSNLIAATSTPLPQTKPGNLTTPLNVTRLENILGGDAEIEDDGVVIVSVPRKERFTLAGVHVESDLGIAHTINFQPLPDGTTAVAPDYALIASEVNPVMSLMRKKNFTVHCLYNQETAESPQLYFSHQLAIGDAYRLARSIRKALEKTNAEFK